MSLWYNLPVDIRVLGSYFRLQVLGYKYPDAEGEPYDANWLLIRVDAAGAQGAWSVIDSCLLAHEVDYLADWLDAIRSGKQYSPALTFLEPALLFRCLDRGENGKVLRIHFGNLVHPDWATNVMVSGKNPDIWLDFPIADIDVGELVRSLRDQLSKFPERYER